MSGISVIIPAFNNGPYVRESIESVLAQTVTPHEIIVVDDGSTDDTEAVVQPYTGDTLRYVKQTNQGVSAARNLGIELATGEYLAFLDADDRWRPTMLESRLQLINASPELVCCFANFVRFVHGTGESLGDQFQYFPELHTTPSSELPGGVGRIFDGMAFPALISWSDFPAFGLTMLFRTSLLGDVRFNRRLVRCQDADFLLRACMRGRIAYSTAIVADVRRHGGNATGDVGMMALDKLKALQAVSEDPLAQQWSRELDDRLVRARFDAANALLRRTRWAEAASHISHALGARGSLPRKAKGVVRAALTAVSAVSERRSS